MPTPSFAWAELTIDCTHPERAARFWGALLGVAVEGPDEGWYRINSLVSAGPCINFQPVPEPKDAKARAHLDIWTDDLGAAVERALFLGATKVAAIPSTEDATGCVMSDPEGNEFCLVGPPAG